MAHLLIVDNDERIVELTSWFLERSGHRVDTALSYAAARTLIAEARPDLMLADLDLGEEQGREELPRLAAEGLLPPTIVVSGFLDADLECELNRIPGVLGSLTKPVDLTSLEALIGDSLRVEAAGEADDRFTLPAQPRSQAASSSQQQKDRGVADLESRHVEPRPSARASDEEEGWVEIVPLSPDVPPASEC